MVSSCPCRMAPGVLGKETDPSQMPQLRNAHSHGVTLPDVCSPAAELARIVLGVPPEIWDFLAVSVESSSSKLPSLVKKLVGGVGLGMPPISETAVRRSRPLTGWYCRTST